jgi:hypothetical protein
VAILHGLVLIATAFQLDSAALRKELQRTATDYERALRRFAPYRLGGGGGRCDEIVGRFCLTYDAGRGARLPKEPEQIKRARQRAIEAYRRAVARWPEDSAVVGGLVRYLVEDSLPDEAVTHAERLAAAGGSSPWPHLLLGFALHSAEKAQRAQAAFAEALARLDSVPRTRAVEVRELLKPDEKSRYNRLGPLERQAYRERLWQLADPLFLTTGNEVRNEHLARYVWSRLLSKTPVVLGSYSWGNDLEELTRRFGVPRARTQDYSSPGSLEPRITEHYDPEQLTYVPPELLEQGLTDIPLPGAAWPYDTIRSRSGFAPKTVRAMTTLEHQASRFPIEDSVALRVDAELPLDSLIKYPATVEFGLFVIDSTYAILAEVRDTIVVDSGRTAVGRLSVALPDGAFGYSMEAREVGTRLAGRARYRLPPPLPIGRPTASDLVILQSADGSPPRDRSAAEFRPLSSLAIPRDQPVSLYLELSGLTRGADDQASYRIDLQVVEAPPGALTRAVRRIGSAVGIEPSVAPRISWIEQAPGYGTVPVALSLGQLQLKPGVRTLRLIITDLISGAQNQADRTVRIR